MSTGEKQDARDSGLATIWTAGAIAALLLLASGVFALGAVVATRHRAGSAADLAALAAAAYAPDGESAACARARWVTDRMRVNLTSCRLVGWDALVQVSARPPAMLARFGGVAAHARAGPAPP